MSGSNQPNTFQKQKFYIIAHNPNTLAEAEDYLKAGANALEPDICYVTGKHEEYFVSHDHSAFSNPFTPPNSLRAYMAGLRQLITPSPDGSRLGYDLALIAFDYKDGGSGGNINDMLEIVWEEFSQYPECAGVAILVTVSDIADADFLGKYHQNFPNGGVGIDEENSPTAVVDKLTALNQSRIAYANGIIAPGVKEVFSSIAAAKGLQAFNAGNNPQLVYTWVLANADSIRSYLDLGIDGIIVNLSTVPTLKAILQEKHFLPMYELAHKGYNPWGQLPPPSYGFTVYTADTYLAGTDAKIQFTLKGSLGSLTRVIDASYKNIFEQGGTNTFSLNGLNIGDVQSLTVEALTSDINSDWLPLCIQINSHYLPGAVYFNFGANEWVVKGKPLVKFPELASAA